ncbi:cell wall hydrolase [Bosea sp. (in: a-proteobacteria)]|uniref:cell wall hydrolase n=1 Tax=Bosea sp. (in: a-proteobacteria) TaxID=1871050 RepID=UPI002FCC49B5
MKRLAPPALVALAAFVALPAATTPATSPTNPGMPVGIDSDTRDIFGQPVRLNGVDADEIGHVVKPDFLPGLVPASLTLDAIHGWGSDGGPRSGFSPYPQNERQADPAPPETSPPEASPPQSASLPSGDGATPVALGPAAHDSATPMSERTANATASVTPPAMPAAIESDPEPRQLYRGLIKSEDMAREQRCLAEAVYFEARSEPEEGRAAVAQVVLNRVKSGTYPDSVCGVVYQNRHRKLACQFTFACEGKSLRITEPESWAAAVRIARDVYEGTIYLTEVAASTHYHADYVSPRWAKKLTKMDVIGRHIFYSSDPVRVSQAP